MNTIVKVVDTTSEEEAIVASLCTSEVLEELIQRLELTNGLDFCAPARVKYAVMLLEGFSPGTEANPPQEGPAVEPIVGFPVTIPVEHNVLFDGVKVEKLNVKEEAFVKTRPLTAAALGLHRPNPHRFDMVQRGADYGRVDTIGRTNGFSRKWSKAVKKDADCMYRQVRKMLQSEGRW